MCLQDFLWWALYKAENFLVGSWLRKKALAECMKHIHYEVGPQLHGTLACDHAATTWLQVGLLRICAGGVLVARQ